MTRWCGQQESRDAGVIMRPVDPLHPEKHWGHIHVRYELLWEYTSSGDNPAEGGSWTAIINIPTPLKLYYLPGSSDRADQQWLPGLQEMKAWVAIDEDVDRGRVRNSVHAEWTRDVFSNIVKAAIQEGIGYCAASFGLREGTNLCLRSMYCPTGETCKYSEYD